MNSSCAITASARDPIARLTVTTPALRIEPYLGRPFILRNSGFLSCLSDGRSCMVTKTFEIGLEIARRRGKMAPSRKPP